MTRNSAFARTAGTLVYLGLLGAIACNRSCSEPKPQDRRVSQGGVATSSASVPLIAKSIGVPLDEDIAVRVQRMSTELFPPTLPQQAWVLPLQSALWCGGSDKPCAPCFPVQKLVNSFSDRVRWLHDNIESFEDLSAGDLDSMRDPLTRAHQGLEDLRQVVSNIENSPRANGCVPPPPSAAPSSDQRTFVSLDYQSLCEMDEGAEPPISIEPGSKDDYFQPCPLQ